jgi:hypothetical protein
MNLRQRQQTEIMMHYIKFSEIISIFGPKNGTRCEVLILKFSLGRNDSQLFIRFFPSTAETMIFPKLLIFLHR